MNRGLINFFSQVKENQTGKRAALFLTGTVSLVLPSTLSGYILQRKKEIHIHIQCMTKQRY